MKKLFVLLAIVFLYGCGDQDPYNNTEGTLKGTSQVKESVIAQKYQVVEIEGCEYIVYSSFSGYAGFGYMAHKGNCKNPIHIHNGGNHE